MKNIRLLKKFFTIGLMISSLLIGTTNSLPVFAAESLGIYLYQDINYGGDFVRISPTNSIYDSSGRFVGNAEEYFTDRFNDYFSSIRINGPFKIALYEHIFKNQYQSGKSVVFYGNIPSLVSYGWNDLASSARLDFKSTGVYLFTNDNYEGDWVRIDSSNRVFNSNGSLVSDTCEYDLGYALNDQFSSLKIVGNYQVTLYENNMCNNERVGYASLFKSDFAGLITRGMNNMVSSAKVETKDVTGVYLYESYNKGGRCIRVENNRLDNLGKYRFGGITSCVEYINKSNPTAVPNVYLELYTSLNCNPSNAYKAIIPLALNGATSTYTNLTISQNDNRANSALVAIP